MQDSAVTWFEMVRFLIDFMRNDLVKMAGPERLKSVSLNAEDCWSYQVYRYVGMSFFLVTWNPARTFNEGKWTDMPFAVEMVRCFRSSRD